MIGKDDGPVPVADHHCQQRSFTQRERENLVRADLLTKADRILERHLPAF